MGRQAGEFSLDRIRVVEVVPRDMFGTEDSFPATVSSNTRDVEANVGAEFVETTLFLLGR